MPLEKGKSQKAFEHNVKTEMHHDKPLKQSLAIAYAMKRKAQHKAEGGDASMGDMHMCRGGGCEHPSHKMGMAEGGYASDAHAAAMSKRERAIHAFKGGMLTKDGYQHEEDEVDGGNAHPMAEEHVEHPESHDSMVSHDVMNQEGEEDEGAGDGNEMDPVVMKIVMGRAKGYSKGGMVANEGSGESASEPDDMAKWEDNEFDELGKSGGLDGHYSGSEKIGDEQEDHDRDDIVKRVMKSRSKRDRMAVAGEGSTYGKGR